MLETLLQREAQWLSGEGPEADVAVYSLCQLFRNLADFPFPSQCTDDERQTIEERVLGVLDSLNLLATGQYWSFADLDERERRFLVERRLVRPQLLDAEGARGVYIADDQSFSININDENHLTFNGLASGLQIHEIWSRMSLIDDTLAGVLDYAFSERLGYLTAEIGQVGTGLLASVVLHLPGSHLTNRVSNAVNMAREKRHTLESIVVPKAIMPIDARPPNGSALGDLHKLTNSSTLGRSEEETLFHLKHLALDLIKSERESREQIVSDAPLQLEDRVGRALGLARGARLLAFHEANSVLSSLRLGVSSGLLDQFSLHQINDVLMGSQNAHIEMKCGHDCDELTLSAERADLFRSRFA
ncbi:MAG: hypothetical protein QGD90_07430 [Candidatus Hydrogenedentes bacterium]|nr:hypothetical protein [Candidatus Hydrogenedentota bacterium]